MKRLVVNADDFGYTRGVNAGIVKAFHEGILTSTTLMANGDAWEEAVELAKMNPKLGVGCHLVLVGGKAVAPRQQIPSLVDTEGHLPATLPLLLARISAGRIKRGDIEQELRAQIGRIVESGIRPTHADSHKHAHAHPRIMSAVTKVAEEFGIRWIRKPYEDLAMLLRSPGRSGFASWKRRGMALAAQTGAAQFKRIAREYGIKTPEHFWGVAATGRLSRQAILAIIEAIPEGTNELMCHPGEYDQDLELSATHLKREREAELAALTDLEVRKALEAQNIHLTDFRGLDSAP